MLLAKVRRALCQNREIRKLDMVQKIGLESSTNCFTMVSHHTKLLRMHLAVISSPGKVSEQNSSGFRKRCGLEAVAAGDDKGFIPSTGALRDCLNVEKMF